MQNGMIFGDAQIGNTTISTIIARLLIAPEKNRGSLDFIFSCLEVSLKCRYQKLHR